MPKLRVKPAHGAPAPPDAQPARGSASGDGAPAAKRQRADGAVGASAGAGAAHAANSGAGASGAGAGVAGGGRGGTQAGAGAAEEGLAGLLGAPAILSQRTEAQSGDWFVHAQWCNLSVCEPEVAWLRAWMLVSCGLIGRWWAMR